MNRKQERELQDALLSAFPSRSALEQMVYFELETSLDQIVQAGALTTTVLDLIKWVAANGKIDQLIEGARRVNVTHLRGA